MNVKLRGSMLDLIRNKQNIFWALKNADFADSRKENLRFLRESASSLFG